MLREITCADVVVSVEAEPSTLGLQGNLIDSGDPEVDRGVIKSVVDRLNRGDIWAWCEVTVTVSFKGILHSKQYLNACSYEDEDDFASGGYFDDMIKDGVEELNDIVRDLVEALGKEAE